MNSFHFVSPINDMSYASDANKESVTRFVRKHVWKKKSLGLRWQIWWQMIVEHILTLLKLKKFKSTGDVFQPFTKYNSKLHPQESLIDKSPRILNDRQIHKINCNTLLFHEKYWEVLPKNNPTGNVPPSAIGSRLNLKMGTTFRTSKS